jgi:carboxyl-terminal processing protease
MKPTRRIFWFFLATILVCALLGPIYGPRVEATTGGDGGEGAVAQDLDTFSKVFSLVQQNYAVPVNPDRAIFGPESSNNLGAIPGMLRTLDPHSNFFDQRTFARLRETQEGRYYGVGMRILTVPGEMGKWVTTVVQPMPGSPAFRAGLRPGDTILKVDGKPTLGLDGDTVAKMLKGPKGTIVHVTVTREGYDQPLDFAVTRAEITGMSVDDYFLIRPGIAYIHISSFTESTNDELAHALNQLGGKNLKGLILDLRGNPGGLLQAAVDVSEHFLQKHQLIVYHVGRHSPEKRYYVEHGDHGEDYPIVVLVNHSTASAAEIVTGALQDHDRALVMGQTSFGKGLVQTVYPLSEGTGLALTTAHYYTPSGRLIQRDYEDVSLYDYLYAPLRPPSTPSEVRLTDGGRTVYGGGGITPDIKVDVAKLNPVESRLMVGGGCPGQDLTQCGAFFDFGKYYLGVHKTIPRDFQPDDAVVKAFADFLAKKGLVLSDKDVQANADFIKSHIRDVLVDMIYGVDAAQHLSVENDSEVQKAIEALPQAAALLTHAKKYMASHPETNRPAPVD